jgi:tetratricopeptide (TPR) repeat protein
MAAADFTRALSLDGKVAWLWSLRGETQVRLKRYRRAASDFGRAASLPEGNNYRRDEALAYLAAGDTASYRNVCKLLLVVDTMGVTWAFGLGPDATTNWEPVLRLAEKEAKDYPTSVNPGIVLYRMGRFDDAARRLGAVIAAKGRDPSVAAEFTLSMACYRMGKGEEARAWLDKAVKHHEALLAKKSQLGDEFLSWHEKLRLELLRREAEVLLNKTAARPNMTGQRGPGTCTKGGSSRSPSRKTPTCSRFAGTWNATRCAAGW